MASTLDDLTAALSAPVGVEDYTIGPLTVAIGPIVAFDSFLDLGNQAEALTRIAKTNPIEFNGREVKQSRELVTVALTLVHGVQSPRLDYKTAAKLLARYGREAASCAARINALSGFDLDKEIEQAEADLQADPPASGN